MIVDRLNDKSLEEARKDAIRNYNQIKFYTTPSNSTLAITSIAASNLVIVELLTRILEEMPKKAKIHRRESS